MQVNRRSKEVKITWRPHFDLPHDHNQSSSNEFDYTSIIIYPSTYTNIAFTCQQGRYAPVELSGSFGESELLHITRNSLPQVREKLKSWRPFALLADVLDCFGLVLLYIVNKLRVLNYSPRPLALNYSYPLRLACSCGLHKISNLLAKRIEIPLLLARHKS